jgi:hypothetical protein
MYFGNPDSGVGSMKVATVGAETVEVHNDG